MNGNTMNQNPYLKQYKQNYVEAASREDLFLMLFNALLKYISKMRQAMVDKNPAEVQNNSTKAIKILEEFLKTLDDSANPELAENLRKIYHYNIKLLLDGNIKNNTDMIDESFNMLSGFRDVWKQAIEAYKAKEASLYAQSKEADDEEQFDKYEIRNSDEPVDSYEPDTTSEQVAEYETENANEQ